MTINSLSMEQHFSFRSICEVVNFFSLKIIVVIGQFWSLFQETL
jgi:hypothetical protein